MKKCNTCSKMLDLSEFKKGDTYIGRCIECRKKYVRRYQETKSKHLCFTCGASSKNNSQCEKCKKKFKIRARKARKRAKSENLCICCYKRQPLPDYSTCKVCRDSRSWGNRDLASLLLSQAKYRARKKCIEFSITKEDIVLPDECPILKIKLSRNKGHFDDNSYSLDRINPDRGYVPGNVQVISHRANQIKNNATISELEALLEYLKMLNK